jgi:hypothetical protein
MIAASSALAAKQVSRHRAGAVKRGEISGALVCGSSKRVIKR